MKVKYILLLFSAFLLGKMSAQTYAANNFTMISVINPETGFNVYQAKYSACWGWYQASLNKEYAIACSKSGTYWVDVTNAGTPTISAFAAGTTSNGVWRETKTYQNYCYVVCDDNSSTGFQIFDMATLPTTVTLKYQGNSYFKRGHAAWVDGNKLYVSGVTYSNNTTSSMNVYSLATPTAPVLLRQLKQDYSFITYVHDMFVRNDTVYAHCGNQGMYVFKFNTATNTFTQLGSLTTYSSQGYNHSSALTPNGQTLVFTDEVPAGLPIKVANVSNLSNIQVLATTNQFSQTTPHNPFMVSNSLCFMSSYQDGTQLYNISTPSVPVLAGYFDTYYQAGGNNNNWSGDDYQGQWGMYPYFPSKNIFALDQKNGIFMLKSHLYQNPLPAFSVLNGCVGSPVSITNTSTYSTIYNWSFPGGSPATSTATNPSVTYTASGVYTISLLAANLTTTTAMMTKTVLIGGGMTASAVSSSASCGACADGSASVTFSGNVAPPTFTWMPSGGNAATATNLLPGCYTVTVTDPAQCSTTATTCIGFVTGIKNNSGTSSFAVYPNPATQIVTIEAVGSFSYALFNQLGQSVRSGKNNQQKTTIDLNGLAKGVYFIEIQSGKEKLRKKLIVE
jgi:choice-of-anchor B domain-containing protein